MSSPNVASAPAPQSGPGSCRSTSPGILRAAPGRVTALWLLGLAAVGLALVMPNQVGRLTRLFGSDADVRWGPVMRAVASIIGAQFGLSLIGLFRTRIDSVLRQDMIRRYMLGLYRRVLRLRPEFFRAQEVEHINVRALEDTSRVVSFRVDVLIGAPLALIFLAAIGTVMARIHLLLAACIVPLSLLSGYSVLFDRRIQKVNRQARRTWDRVRSMAAELIGGVAEFRNHHAFDYGLSRLARPADELHASMVEVGRLTALFSSLSPLVASVQTAILFAVGAALCMGESPSMTWSGVIQFMLLAQVLQQPVGQIAGYLLQWRMNRECIRRIDEFLEEPAPFEETPEAGPAPGIDPAGGLAFDGLALEGSGGERIVTGVTASVAPGAVSVICGPSGCGKSTLLQPLSRGLEPAAGCVRLGGRPLGEFPHPAWAAATGIVPQRAMILNDTLRGNLLLGLRRPGPGPADADGPLDTGRRPEIRTPADVDRMLVNVVREVGLEADILRKFLDAPLPRGPRADRVRAVCARLREAVRKGAGIGPAPDAASPPVGWRDDRPVRDNLLEGFLSPGRTLPKDRAEESIRQALGGEGLADDALLLGLECPAGEDGRLLSGGQRQKIAIGRALIKNPALLVLDEATASLDETSQDLVMRRIRGQFRDRIIVSVTHRLSIVEDADPVLVMDRGRVVQNGPAAALAAEPGLFRELLRRERGAADARPPEGGAEAEGADELVRRMALTHLFGRLDRAQLGKIARRCRVARYAAGETVFQRGDPGNDLFVVLEGAVDFLAPAEPDGEPGPSVVRTAGPGDAFGELALFGGGRRSLGARAAGATRLAAVSREDLLDLLGANPDLSVRLMETMALRMIRVTEEACGPMPSAA